jgi:hypothetical protein
LVDISRQSDAGVDRVGARTSGRVALEGMMTQWVHDQQ